MRSSAARKPKTIDVQEHYDALRGEFLLKAKRSSVFQNLGERGRNEEERVRKFLRHVLPRRFSVGSSVVVSSNKALGASSHMDVVIYDEFDNAPFSFEEIVLAIEANGLKDILVHPNQRRYPGQVVLIVIYRNYAFLVPSIEEDTHYFLKTIIPSRKATRDYLGMEGTDEKA